MVEKVFYGLEWLNKRVFWQGNGGKKIGKSRKKKSRSP